MLSAVGLLNQINNSGDTGKMLLGFFNTDEHDLKVRGSNSYTSSNTVARFDRGLSKVKLPTKTDGFTKLVEADPWLSLGHEIAHVYARIKYGNDVNDKKWYNLEGAKDPSQSEIIASHFENMIRKESGIPLRSYYSITNKTDGTKEYNGQLIDNKNRSLHFNNSSPPTIEINLKNNKILQIKAKERHVY